MDFIVSVFITGYQILSVFLPTLNYLPQYRLMCHEKSTGAFAKQMCYMLIMANLLRIAFWFQKRFELCIFLQSIIVFLLQILLLHKYVEIQYRQMIGFNILTFEHIHDQKKKFRRVNKQLFLMLAPFLGTYLVITLIMLTLQSQVLSEVAGGIASALDVLIPLPQICTSWKYKSVKGLRYA